MTVDEFFEGRATSRRLYDAVARHIAHLGKASIRVSKSQIAFRRSRNFAVVWIPARYLTGKVAPLVLTLSFRHRDPSSRWKEIVAAGPGRYTHHLELFKTSDMDAQVDEWLQAAWNDA